EPPEVADLVRRRAGAGGDRILVLGWNGVHPDARAQALRKLWALEERCRAGGVPTLALRLAPLVGPAAPLWRAVAELRVDARRDRCRRRPSDGEREAAGREPQRAAAPPIVHAGAKLAALGRGHAPRACGRNAGGGWLRRAHRQRHSLPLQRPWRRSGRETDRA